MGLGQKIRVATHIEVEWLGEETAASVCPNCGIMGPARQYLEIDYRPPDAAHRFVLQICPHCTARFVDNTHTMDYATDELIELGWNTYQVQIGAGVWPISAPLTRLAKPPGARLLEIGGAYGFGLDFGIRAQGWKGEGFDPSPLAAFGARELGLTIHQEYFEEKDLASGPWDVVIATEVIEHIGRPPEFLALMRRALAEDGMLILTTPDAEWITSELSAGALMPLLSPGAHLVLQTQASLRAALLASGFAHVVVKRDAMSLVAYASPSPFALNEDAAAARAMYRRYLVERAALTAPGSDLRLGFAGRGLFEAANDGDGDAAEAAWAALVPAVQERFGFELATMQSLPEGADTASLAELAQIMPLGLGMILFGRAMQLLGAGTDRPSLLPLLRTASAAIAALQDALAKRSLTDGLSASIGRILDGEIPLCLAESGDPVCVERLVRLGDVVLGWRGFVALVNAGALEAARALKDAMLSQMPAQDLPDDLKRNALLSLANFALAPGGETMLAYDYAAALRALGAPSEAIMLNVFTRLVNASRYAEAEALARREPCFARLSETGGTAAEDAQIATIVLDLHCDRPEAAVRRIGLLMQSGGNDVLGPLLVDGFVRLVNEGKFAAASQLAKNRAVERHLPACKPAQRHDALAAFVLLELQPGGSAAGIEQRLQEALQGGVAEDRLRVLVLAAFVTCVNAAEFAAARQLLRLVEPILLELRPPYGEGERNAMFAAGILYLQEQDDRRRSAAVFARLRDALLKLAAPGTVPDALFWPALRGEVLALHHLNRGAEATVLLQTFTEAYPGAPDDLREQIESPKR